jgi:DNA-binding transcriptional LysR family regulator
VDIKQLRFFMALAREEHFGRAAERCHVSQPTLSARIRQLEEELGAPLIDRTHHAFHGLTVEGERVLHWARRITADCDAMHQELSGMTSEMRGELVIGAIPTALSFTPLLTEPFSLQHPNVSLTVLTQSSKAIQRGLDEYEIQAGISYIDNEPLKNVRHVPFYQESYCLVYATALVSRVPGIADHAPADGVAWVEAARLPMAALTTDMQFRRIVDDAFNKAGVDMTPLIETNSITSLWAHVLAGSVAGVVPAGLVDQLAPDVRVNVRPLIEPHITHEIGLLVADREPASPLSQALCLVAEQLSL